MAVTALIDYKDEMQVHCSRKYWYMLPVTTNEFKEYLVWVFALAVVLFGFRHAKEIIVFVLDKLYQVFIQNNPNAA